MKYYQSYRNKLSLDRNKKLKIISYLNQIKFREKVKLKRSRRFGGNKATELLSNCTNFTLESTTSVFFENQETQGTKIQ